LQRLQVRLPAESIAMGWVDYALRCRFWPQFSPASRFILASGVLGCC